MSLTDATCTLQEHIAQKPEHIKRRNERLQLDKVRPGSQPSLLFKAHLS
jgi:hypothetical protein